MKGLYSPAQKLLLDLAMEWMRRHVNLVSIGDDERAAAALCVYDVFRASVLAAYRMPF